MNSANSNSDWIDGSLYPEQPVPKRITALPEKVDFLVRVCAAWDFGLLPRTSTLSEILRDDWKSVIEEAQFLTSCAYHLLRELHHLEPLPYLGPQFPQILNDPFLERV